ncbi:hypothetical protein TRFO_02724 [Tritrichomonas foetus]|uniref:ELMO domain-containing protein n=1 Tax=Tritrichomonas foetus TaxID=1144522 RepID=A0A1J4L005_9EUKA|nr:hypothetical protein TRFO_02724 [Tritrichomonas foetus]|eukprot:OHT16456.1 hypothetical protein TRFO_02724 [Tritrichomonas foetus]
MSSHKENSSSDSDSFNTDESENNDEIPEDVKNARDQWNQIEQQQEELNTKLETKKGVGGVVIDRGSPITFFDARAFLVDESKEVTCKVPDLVMDPPRCFCFRPKRNMNAVTTWEKIYRISKIPFNEENILHHRILNTLHSLMTGCTTPPARKGAHWETIGFQSQDPITDLRGAGMMGLLLPLNLFAKFKVLSKFLIDTARLPEQNFPIMVVLISYTKAAIETAGSTDILKSGNSFESCWERLTLLFAGMVYQLCTEWRNEMLDIEHDFKRFDQISNRAKSRPLATIEKGIQAQKEDDKDAPNIREDKETNDVNELLMPVK